MRRKKIKGGSRSKGHNNVGSSDIIRHQNVASSDIIRHQNVASSDIIRHQNVASSDIIRHQNVAPAVLFLGLGSLGVAYGLHTKELAKQIQTNIDRKIHEQAVTAARREKFMNDIQVLSQSHALNVTTQQLLIDKVIADIAVISTEMKKCDDMTEAQLFEHVISESYDNTSACITNPELNLLIDELQNETKINRYLTTTKPDQLEKPNLILINNLIAEVEINESIPKTFTVPENCLITIIYVSTQNKLDENIISQLLTVIVSLDFETITLIQMLKYMFASNDLKPIVLSYVAGDKVLDKLFSFSPNIRENIRYINFEDKLFYPLQKKDIEEIHLSDYLKEDIEERPHNNLVILDISCFNNGQSNAQLLKSLTSRKCFQ